MIALYLPMGDEAPAARFATHLRAAGKALCLPRVVDSEGMMSFHHWDEQDQLDPGLFGIRQPAGDAPLAEPDMILAPLLAFDRALGRLGQGRGYYDRAFAAHPNAIRIGIGWSVQEVDRVPTDPWDVPLHAIVTECEYIEGVPAT
jgi:5-formyltetrahydrofolate cyclo-ligase